MRVTNRVIHWTTQAGLFLFLPVIICLLMVNPGQAQDLPPVSVSGFMDVQMTTDHEDSTASDFSLGQVEVDFDAEISKFSAISIAVAYDADAEAFALGAATVDFRLGGSAEDHPYEVSWLATSGVIIGQFDVPFGLDPLVYPSIDRNLVTSPLAVLGTHDQWNDVGITVYAEGERYHATAYLTNGFSRDGIDADDADVTSAAKRAGGGRVGLLPFEGLEIGVSGATLGGIDPDQSMSLFGTDLQLSHGAWDFKAEYISHKIEYAADLNPTNEGYYVQGMHTFSKWYAVARYDDFSPEELGLEKQERLSIGAGLPVFDSAVLRGEFQSGISDNLDDTWVLQMAAGF